MSNAKKWLVNTLKKAGQIIQNKAEEIVGDITDCTNINVAINFDVGELPNIKVTKTFVIKQTLPKSETIEEFEEGKKYRFSKKLFLQDPEVNSEYKTAIPSWVEKCNGKEVKIITPYTGAIGLFLIKPAWCEVIEND